MNTEPQYPETSPDPPTPSNAAFGTPHSPLRTPHSTRRRTGKIASLPYPTRERINRMLQDGVQYPAIIESLHAPGAPPLPHEVNKHHLSEWKDGGFQDWLKDQFWQQEMRERHETFSRLLATGIDALRLPEGGLQLAVINLCELLRDISELCEEPRTDPDKCARLANSLARVSRSILQLQQYRDACARARAAIQKLTDPNRKLDDRETHALVRRVDSILGLQSIDGLGPEERRIEKGDGDENGHGRKAPQRESEEMPNGLDPELRGCAGEEVPSGEGRLAADESAPCPLSASSSDIASATADGRDG